MTGDGSGPGGFQAYIAVFGNRDRVGEVLVAGSIKNIPSFISDGWSSFDHYGTKFPIATINDAKQDAVGLWIDAEFHSNAEAQEARTIMAERLSRGKSVKTSILYRVLEDEWKDSTRYLKSIDVFEGGPVMLPANNAAGVTSVKSEDDGAINSPEPGSKGINRLFARFLETEAQLKP
jgi:uncharacterized protein